MPEDEEERVLNRPLPTCWVLTATLLTGQGSAVRPT